MKTILVTGGAGYIGSHACKAISKASFCPVVYDNLSTGHRASVKWGPLVIGELTDTQQLKETIHQYQPVAVMHFAATSLVGASITDPAKCYKNNVQGTLSLLEAIGSLPLIFSSTCAVYGAPIHASIDEGHPKSPLSPYGRSKLMIEQIIKDFHAAYGLPYAILRYFNAAGADLDLEIGEAHHPETHLIPLALTAPYIHIYGTDYPTRDGTAIRDYIHVTDLAEAHVKALKLLLNGRQCLELNLGTGIGLSVQEIITSIEQISHQKVTTYLDKRREGDPAVLIADVAAATKTLDWAPKYSDLNTIITTAWKWHKKQSF